MGFGLTSDDIRSTAYKIAEACGKPHPFHNEMAGRAWLDVFRRRYPNLTLRKPQPLSYSRAISANIDTINDYFAKLGALYARLNILTKPICKYTIWMNAVFLSCTSREKL